ncbi:MAG: YceH family protein [Solirubrobacteraceae bacterium]
MHRSELTVPEQRVLGCLIEKRWTTPEQYPLSLNALRLACNQSTNRDPVTAYDETTVRDAAQRLSHYGLARLASGHNSRAIKYRHLGEEALSLDRPHLALLAILLLRGSQTPGELKLRSERLAPVATLDEVERLLGELSERGYAHRLDRRPGQKEDRFEHLLGAADEEAPVAVTASHPPPSSNPAAPASPTPARTPDDLPDRVTALEAEVRRLADELARLCDELGISADA